MKAYKKKIKNKDLYKEHINILNGLLKLTGKEAEVFSILLQISMEQKPMFGKKQDILSTDNRRIIMGETNINKNNLSKYISVLKDKNILLEDDGGHYINQMFIPDINNNTSETLFILNIDNEGDSN